MASIYFDLDQFGYKKKIHTLISEHFLEKYKLLQKRFYASHKDKLNNVPKEIPSCEIVLLEVKGGEKKKVDFKIMADIMKDLQNPQIQYFIIASHDTDFITHAEEIHTHGKYFGILWIDNQKQKLSENLKQQCDILLTIANGSLETTYKHSQLSLPLKTDPPKRLPVLYSNLEAWKANTILVWVNYKCKTYLKHALEIEDFLTKITKQSGKPLASVSYTILHRDESNVLFSPSVFHCTCSAIPDPFHKGPERCPVFQLYKQGYIEKQIVGLDLPTLKTAIETVYDLTHCMTPPP
jgi:uncharacterized LabA/DUF88 family protein